MDVSNKSQIAAQALQSISALYDIEREVKNLTSDERLQIRQARSRPLANAMHEWMMLQRQKITDGSATAKALDYSLKRWSALTRFLGDRQVPATGSSATSAVGSVARASPELGSLLARIRIKAAVRGEADIEAATNLSVGIRPATRASTDISSSTSMQASLNPAVTANITTRPL